MRLRVKKVMPARGGIDDTYIEELCNHYLYGVDQFLVLKRIHALPTVPNEVRQMKSTTYSAVALLSSSSSSSYFTSVPYIRYFIQDHPFPTRPLLLRFPSTLT